MSSMPHLRCLAAATPAAAVLACLFACERPDGKPTEQPAAESAKATTSTPMPSTDTAPASTTPEIQSPEVANPDANDLILDNGSRAGLRFEGLRGTPEDPIVIRPADPSRPILVMNPTGDWSIELLDCRHVRIQSMQVFNADAGGVLIQGTPDSPCRDIAITASDILPRSSTLDYEIGLRIEHAEDVRVADVKILHAMEAGVDVQHARSIRLENVVVRGVGPERYGVRLGTGVENATIRQVACVSLAGEAFGLGIVDPGEQATLERGELEVACTNVVLSRCSTDLGRSPIALGSVSDVLVEYCTFMLPSEFVVRTEPAGLGWAPPKGVRMKRNLVEWLPSSLLGIFDPAARNAVQELGPNLWWSAELPEMLPALGGFPHSDDRQRIDLDPKILRDRLQPLDAESIKFGFLAPEALERPANR